MSICSIQTNNSYSLKEKNEIFQDLPLLDRRVRLTVIELRNSDKLIVNELTYRWCRLLTREPKKRVDDEPGLTSQDNRKVLIIDLIGSVNSIRLATVLKKNERRMRMVGVVHGCKINATYVTLQAYLKAQSSLKLIVIYQDEFFILKTLNLLKECIQNMKCQVLLVVPHVDRQERDILNLTSNYQILKCDFQTSRSEIGSTMAETGCESYHSFLNQIYFQRFHHSEALPDKVCGELREDGLSIEQPGKLLEKKLKLDQSLISKKKVKSE